MFQKSIWWDGGVNALHKHNDDPKGCSKVILCTSMKWDSPHDLVKCILFIVFLCCNVIYCKWRPGRVATRGREAWSEFRVQSPTFLVCQAPFCAWIYRHFSSVFCCLQAAAMPPNNMILARPHIRHRQKEGWKVWIVTFIFILWCKDSRRYLRQK